MILGFVCIMALRIVCLLVFRGSIFLCTLKHAYAFRYFFLVCLGLTFGGVGGEGVSKCMLNVSQQYALELPSVFLTNYCPSANWLQYKVLSKFIYFHFRYFFSFFFVLVKLFCLLYNCELNKYKYIYIFCM